MFFQLYLSILACYLSCVASLPADLVPTSVLERDSNKKYLSLPIKVVRNYVSADGPHQFKRDPIESLIHHAGARYTIDLLFGSNQQPITVILDTGSSDLWVPDAITRCYGLTACNSSELYDPSQSTTSKQLNEFFEVGYLDGSASFGSYYLDDVTFPQGPTIKQVQFGDANSTDVTQGILGIGLNTSEGPIFNGLTKSMYANFPWVLKDQGFIAKAAYSLFLNSPEATSGTVILGGIDNAKIEGSLVELPRVYPSRLGVHGDSITVDGTVTNIGVGIVLDSGYVYSTFPWPVVDAIAAAMNGS